MGPPPFGGGNGEDRTRRRPARPASMGPPPFGGGNVNTVGKGQFKDMRASMGPPPFGGGNEIRRNRLSYLIGASMGPPPFGGGNESLATWKTKPLRLQWGLRLSAVESFKPSKVQTLDIIASMGPPPFGGGNSTYRIRGSPVGIASMGPPPFGGGNVFAVVFAVAEKRLLQWGLRLSAVEIRS